MISASNCCDLSACKLQLNNEPTQLNSVLGSTAPHLLITLLILSDHMDLESRATKERIKETTNKVSKNYEPNSPQKNKKYI